MADYATYEDVQNLLPLVTLSAATEPSFDQVTEYCTMRSAEINAVLCGRGYALPISDADALAYLRTVCLYGAAALTLRAKFPTDPQAGGAEEAAYQKALADLRDGRVLVPDATLASGTVAEGFSADHVPLTKRTTEW